MIALTAASHHISLLHSRHVWRRAPHARRGSLAQSRPRRGYAVLRASDQGRQGGLDDLDVAVLRFTLGIPGFDDALIPRVVGAVGTLLLVVNHFLSDSTPTDAQVRAEVLGAALAAVGLIAPSIESLIKDVQPGRGRQAASEAVEGATRVFALQSWLPDAAKQDAAWASFALLRNSNICGLVAVWEGQAVMCRGLVGLPPSAQEAAAAGGDLDAILAAITQALKSSPPLATAYWPDRGSIRSGGAGIPCIPSGARSVLVQPIQPLQAAADPDAAHNLAMQQDGTSGGRGWLILLSERPRGLSASERAWAAAVAGKLWSVLSRVEGKQ